MKRFLLSVTTLLLLILSFVNSSVSVNAADVLAKDTAGIKHQNEDTVHDAKYAFSLRAGSETKIRFWQQSDSGTEKAYQGKIILLENEFVTSPAIHPNSTLSGKVGAYITNVGLYEGKKIDVKITYYWNNISHKGTSITPIIHPYYSRISGQISHYYANMSYEAKWELLHDGNPIKVNMSATIGDVEGNETCGMKLNDGSIQSLACYYNDKQADDVYNCNVNYVKSGDWHYMYGDGKSVCNDRLSGSLRFELDNVSSFSQRYIFYYDNYNYTEAGKRAALPTGAGWDGLIEHNKQKCDIFDRAVNTITSQYVSGGTCYTYATPEEDEKNIAYGWYFYDATPIGSYDVPKPTKGLEKMTNAHPLTYAYDITDAYVSSIGNEGTATNTFAIMQYVPPLNTEYASRHYYKTFSITDTLPENENAKAEYVSANVIDLNRTDVTDKFVIKEENGTVTATAKEESLNQDGFYNNTYILRISFKFLWKNQTTASEKLVNTAQASITPYHSLNAEIRDSNDVTVKAVRKKLIIKKQWNDADDADALRPENITATLLADYYVLGTPVVKDITSGIVVLSEANDWTGFVWIDDPDYTSEVSYSNGIYEYHWKELSIPDGYVSSSATENNITTITNTHIPEMTSLTLCKVWDDENNRDLKRPKSIQVDVLDGENVVRTVTVNETDEVAANEWKVTVSDLIKNKNGNPIHYTIREHNVGNGYTSSASYEKIEDEWKITNTREPEKIKLTVKKVWNDGNDADGLQPKAVKVTLKANGETVNTYTLSKENDWAVTTEELNKYDSGDEIDYTWEEKAVTGYISAQETVNNVTTITNTHEPDRISIQIKKNWNDDNDADGIRTEKVNVSLFADKEKVNTYTITKENGWQLTVDHLLKNKKGKPIDYTWQEESIAGYTPVFDYNAYDVVLTNIHQADRIHLKVRQEWEDYDNADGIRPESVTAVLYADGKPAKDQDGNPITVNLADKDGWNDTVLDVLKNKDGKPIEYSFVQEPVPDGYTTGYSMDSDTFVITSVHEPERVNLTVEKQWNDHDDADGLRPERINIVLFADKEKADTHTLSVANEWKVTVRNLIKNKKGNPIDYTWQEESIPEGYSVSYKAEGDKTVITNTHKHDLTNATLKKIFDDADNADGIRPESIDFRLNADGEEIGTYTLSEKNNWQVAIDNLDMNKGGKKISYTWEEINVPEGYTSEKNIKGSLTEITNTHPQETVDFHVRLQFEDDNDRDGIRPDEVTVGLLADGEEIGTYTLSEANNSVDVKGLPKNKNGKPIQYDFVQKGNPDKYSITYDSKNRTVEIMDKHIPEKVTATVKKIWKDHDNSSGLRPKNIQAALFINGVKSSQTVTLSEENNWEAAIPDLYRYENGIEVVYTFGEVNVPDGYNAKTELTGLSTTITNTLQEKETEESTPESTTKAPETTTPVTTVKQTPGNKSMISPKTGYDFDFDNDLSLPIGIILGVIALLLWLLLMGKNKRGN